MIKKHLILFILANFFFIFSNAQNNGDLIRENFENIQENNPDKELNDDSYLQDLESYKRHPINLNKATGIQLAGLKILSSLQIDNFIAYRKLLGSFVDIHELQAIPDWNIFTIRQILPYVFVSNLKGNDIDFSKIFETSGQSILFRYSTVFQKAKGYTPSLNNSSVRYLGSPEKILLRYSATVGNFFHVGISASKDAGEQFFKGSQKNGFDFYSPHLFFKNYRKIKALALGDFTINMGQGLIQWQGFSISKGSQVINIEKQSEILNPYRSYGQINFHRGVGITIAGNKLSKTVFISSRTLDATFKTDSLGNDFVSALQTSGYHRTSTEIKNSNRQKQLSLGGNITYSKNQFLIGFNSILYHFGTTIRKSSALYNKYSFFGDNLANFSINYSTTILGIHSFGEIAIDNQYSPGLVTGIMVALDKKVDLSFLYRNISRSYHSLYSNAFTEGNTPVNERGFYTGLSININKNVSLNCYADFYSFPWIKYRINSPSKGNDYFIKSSYLYKNISGGLSFHLHDKPENYRPENQRVATVSNNCYLNIKSDFTFQPRNSLLSYSFKGIFSSYIPANGNNENGQIFSSELSYASLNQKIIISAGPSLFLIEGNKIRLYTYENDILFNTSLISYSGTGNRIFINFSYSFNRKYKIFLKFSNYHLNNKPIGSGLDEIPSKNKSEIKVQLIGNF